MGHGSHERLDVGSRRGVHRLCDDQGLVVSRTAERPLCRFVRHVSAEMTLRFASLASPTVRAADDQAMGKARPAAG